MALQPTNTGFYWFCFAEHKCRQCKETFAYGVDISNSTIYFNNDMI